MARENRLREYQSNILERLESARKAGAEMPAGYLGVVVANKNVLVNLQEITEILPIEDIHPVPLVKPWFLGVANVRGVLYAINDLALLQENMRSTLTSDTRMLLVSDAVASNVAFVVDKMIGLRKVDEMMQLDNMQDESMCLKSEVYEDVDGLSWNVLDCDKLVRSKEFVTPYVV